MYYCRKYLFYQVWLNLYYTTIADRRRTVSWSNYSLLSNWCGLTGLWDPNLSTYRKSCVIKRTHTKISLSLSLLVFYVTCNICDGTDVQADWRGCTYSRAPNAIEISQGSLTCPSYTDTGPTFLYGDSDTPPL